MTPEQIGAIFAGLATLLTGLGGIVIAITGRRSRTSDQDRAELRARREHDWKVYTWRPKIRAYIARLREQLADRGVATDDPPPFPELVLPGQDEQASIDGGREP